MQQMKTAPSHAPVQRRAAGPARSIRTTPLAALEAGLTGAAPVQRLQRLHQLALNGSRAVAAPAPEQAAEDQAGGGVIQGMFAGPLAAKLTQADPDHLGHGAPNSRYAVYWNQLRNSNNVAFVQDGAPSFEPPEAGRNYGLLNLREATLDTLLDQNPLLFNQATFADLLAIVTHELVHAVDSLVQGRVLRREDGGNTDDSIFNVIDTELRAWKNEAQVQVQLRPGHLPPTVLVAGWQAITAADINGTFQNAENAAAGNELVDRYVRYVRRECRAYGRDYLHLNQIDDINDFTADWHVRFRDRVLNAMRPLAVTFGNHNL
jgi:hypothetical protein